VLARRQSSSRFREARWLPQATYISSLFVTKENAAEAQKALGQI
jgi:hypothetical protein